MRTIEILLTPPKKHSTHIHSNLGRRLIFIKNEIVDILEQVNDGHLKVMIQLLEDYTEHLKAASIKDYGLRKTKYWYD